MLDGGRSGSGRRHGPLGEEALLDLPDHFGPCDHHGHDVVIKLVGSEPDGAGRHAARFGLEVENIVPVLYVLRAVWKRRYVVQL